MHSIVITNEDTQYSKEELEDDMYTYKNGIYEIWNEDELCFGRHPFRLLTAFSEKLCYAIASLCGEYISDEKADRNFELIEEIAEKYVPKLTELKLPEKIEPVYQTKDGTEVSKYGVWEEDDGILYYHDKDNKEPVEQNTYRVSPKRGYVDHESADLLHSFLQKENITLEEFLTNKKYCIVIDGDEYHEWTKMKNTVLINKDNIVDEY